MDTTKLTDEQLLVYHGELDMRLYSGELKSSEFELYTQIDAELARREITL